MEKGICSTNAIDPLETLTVAADLSCSVLNRPKHSSTTKACPCEFRLELEAGMPIRYHQSRA